MRDRDVKESRVRYVKKRTDGGSQKNSKEESDSEIKRCSEGDRRSGLGQGIMVLLHF